jgi:hypothetical protein
LKKLWAQPSAAPFCFAAQGEPSHARIDFQIAYGYPVLRCPRSPGCYFTAVSAHNLIILQDIAVFIFTYLPPDFYPLLPTPYSLLSAVQNRTTFTALSGSISMIPFDIVVFIFASFAPEWRVTRTTARCPLQNL